MIQELSTTEFRCPGESYSISRAIHLGRLASFHPACRDCPRRDDTEGLSARHLRQLAEVQARAKQPPLFHAEGAGNAAINELSPEVARRIAIEYARQITPAVARAAEIRSTIAVSGDGRLTTAATLAAVVEGLRWSGCEVVDISPASAPCAASAIQHLNADGAVLIGKVEGASRSVGLKFWARGEPLSYGGLLDQVAAGVQRRVNEALVDRPQRKFGPLRYFPAGEVYLGDFRPAYHALRPLRFVLHCTSEPVVAYLQDLLRNVACEIILAECPKGLQGEQVAAAHAHFGIEIHDDGENCCLFDERGQAISADRLLALVAAEFEGPVMRGEGLRQRTFKRMQEERATVALDAAGRLWYANGHAPIADALRTLTLLLVLLSRNDLAFSAVVPAA